MMRDFPIWLQNLNLSGLISFWFMTILFLDCFIIKILLVRLFPILQNHRLMYVKSLTTFKKSGTPANVKKAAQRFAAINWSNRIQQLTDWKMKFMYAGAVLREWGHRRHNLSQNRVFSTATRTLCYFSPQFP